VLPAQADFDAIDLTVATVHRQLEALGLTVEIETDFAGLRRFLDAQGTFANPTFDPARSRMGLHDFWLRVNDRHGRGVGCSAERVFEVVDFVDLMRTGRLWYARGFEDIGHDGGEVPVSLPSRHVGGRVSHSGSTWVHPDRRGQRLAMYLTYLSRALSFGSFASDFNTGIVRHSLSLTRVPRETYGYPNVELVIDDYFPPLKCQDQIYLCWISRAEFVEQAKTWPSQGYHPAPHAPVAAAA
jgi:hypothetical protein